MSCFPLIAFLFSLQSSQNIFYLQPTVDIKTVLSQLMDRLSNYAASSTDVSYPFDVFVINSLSSSLITVTLC